MNWTDAAAEGMPHTHPVPAVCKLLTDNYLVLVVGQAWGVLLGKGGWVPGRVGLLREAARASPLAAGAPCLICHVITLVHAVLTLQR